MNKKLSPGTLVTSTVNNFLIGTVRYRIKKSNNYIIDVATSTGSKTFITNKIKEINTTDNEDLNINITKSPTKTFYFNSSDYRIPQMFTQQGWKKVDTLYKADLVVLGGGTDISPKIYNHGTHLKTQLSNDTRDQAEIALFNRAKQSRKPIVGICRGAQLLHALNGGYLFQHVDNHTSFHLAIYNGETVRVSSTHHQMMADPTVGVVLMHSNEATKKEFMPPDAKFTRFGKTGYDIEAMYYPKTNQLSFQPHPEMIGYTACRRIFFNMVNTLINTK